MSGFQTVKLFLLTNSTHDVIISLTSGRHLYILFHILVFFIMTKITAEDRILIKNLRIEKQWGARRMITEFPNKGWSKTSLNRLCQKIDADGTIARKPGSGRPRSVRTMRNIRRVSELICSQEDNPHSHKSPREIERETGISRGIVQRIVKKIGRAHV